MKKLYEGKTKDVYEYDKHHVLLKFKDDVTGKDGKFDPGENQVAFSIDGQGLANLKMSDMFFKLFEAKGIKTQYVSSDLENKTMLVRKAKSFGAGLEVICRYKAVGSFLRRYESIVEPFQDLRGYVEFTLKDDKNNDPLITEDALVILNILSREELDKLKALTLEISDTIYDVCQDKGLELIDLKLEFAKDVETNEIILVDEVSSGNMRVYQNDEIVDSLELPILLGVK